MDVFCSLLAWWPWFVGGVVLVATVAIFYGFRGAFALALQYWLAMLLALLAIGCIIAVWSYWPEITLWVKGHLPSGVTIPDWVTAWMSVLGLVAAALVFAAVVVLVCAMLGKIGWRRALVSAAILVLLALCAVYVLPIWALAEATPGWAARTWEWMLPRLAWVLLWAALIIGSIGIAIMVLRSSMKWEEKAVGLATLAFVAVVGGFLLNNFDSWSSRMGTSRAAYAATWQKGGVAVASTSPCTSMEEPYTYEATKPAAPFNKAGQCGPVLWHQGHCIWAQGYNSTTPVRLCDKPGEPRGDPPLNIEYVWSADGYAFKDKYRLDPPRYTQFFTVVR